MTSAETLGRQRAHGLSNAAVELAKKGKRSSVDLARIAIDEECDAATIAGFCRVALHLFDPDLLKEAAIMAKPYASVGSELAELLLRIQAGPLEAINLVSAFSRRQPLGIEPVRGRILYILHKSLPHASDGYATRSHGLARAMLDQGADLICLTRPGFPNDLGLGGGPDSGQGDADIETIDGVPYHRLATPKRSDDPPTPKISMIHASFTYLEQAADRLVETISTLRPACVVAASNLATALPACLAARRLGLPFAYEMRGFWELTREAKEPGFLETTTGKLEVYLETQLARASDKVLTLTGPMRSELIQRGVDEECISIVPNACDPEILQPQRPNLELQKRYALPQSVPVIGYVGSFNTYEGLVELVEVCAQLKQRGARFRLILVGSEPADENGNRPLTDQIQQTAKQTGLDDWLIMPGRVPHDEVSEWYSLIDIAPFARKSLPVTELVSPLKPLEALSMGKAVVVSEVGGMQEIVRQGETGMIVSHSDNDALATVLEELIGNAELRSRLGAAGRSWVQSDRTWHTSAGHFVTSMTALID